MLRTKDVSRCVLLGLSFLISTFVGLSSSAEALGVQMSDDVRVRLEEELEERTDGLLKALSEIVLRMHRHRRNDSFVSYTEIIKLLLHSSTQSFEVKPKKEFSGCTHFMLVNNELKVYALFGAMMPSKVSYRDLLTGCRGFSGVFERHREKLYKEASFEVSIECLDGSKSEHITLKRAKEKSAQPTVHTTAVAQSMATKPSIAEEAKAIDARVADVRTYAHMASQTDDFRLPLVNVGIQAAPVPPSYELTPPPPPYPQPSKLRGEATPFVPTISSTNSARVLSEPPSYSAVFEQAQSASNSIVCPKKVIDDAASEFDILSTGIFLQVIEDLLFDSSANTFLMDSGHLVVQIGEINIVFGYNNEHHVLCPCHPPVNFNLIVGITKKALSQQKICVNTIICGRYLEQLFIRVTQNPYTLPKNSSLCRCVR